MRRAVARLGSLGQPGSWNFTSVSRQSSPRALAKVHLVTQPHVGVAEVAVEAFDCCTRSEIAVDAGACDGGGAGADSELAIDRPGVRLGGVVRDVQVSRDLGNGVLAS